MESRTDSKNTPNVVKNQKIENKTKSIRNDSESRRPTNRNPLGHRISEKSDVKRLTIPKKNKMEKPRNK